MEQKAQAQKLADLAQRLFGEFKSHTGDEQFFATLLEEFSSSINVEEQIKLFHAWCLDQHPKVITNTRFRMRSWISNNAHYTRQRRSNIAAPYPPRRTTALPEDL